MFGSIPHKVVYFEYQGFNGTDERLSSSSTEIDKCLHKHVLVCMAVLVMSLEEELCGKQFREKHKKSCTSWPVLLSGHWLTC